MNYRHMTTWLLILTAIIWAAYDIFPFLSGQSGDTISEVLAEWSLKRFIIPFSFGILCGHFFFLRDGYFPQPINLIIIILSVIILDIITGVLNIQFLRYLQTFTYIWFLLGIPIGFFLWPQQKQDKLERINHK